MRTSGETQKAASEEEGVASSWASTAVLCVQAISYLSVCRMLGARCIVW